MGILKGVADGYRGDKKKLNEKKSQKVAISNFIYFFDRERAVS